MKYKTSEAERIKRREMARTRAKKDRATLSDVSMKKYIVRGTGLKHSDISNEVVEIKRLQMQLNRLKKEKYHGPGQD